MKKFCILIRETLEREVFVESPDIYKAIQKVSSEYDRARIVLDSSDIADIEVIVPGWYSEEEIQDMEVTL